MLPSDSAQKPVLHIAPRFRTVWHTAAIVVDMLVVGCATLLYDGVVVALAFGTEVARYSKSVSKPSEAFDMVVIIGLVVGGLVAGYLLLASKYYRALAVLAGLIPLALFVQLIHSLTNGY